MFPISRDPPEGGTKLLSILKIFSICSFQFLGIPPKGERFWDQPAPAPTQAVSNF